MEKKDKNSLMFENFAAIHENKWMWIAFSKAVANLNEFICFEFTMKFTSTAMERKQKANLIFYNKRNVSAYNML